MGEKNGVVVNVRSLNRRVSGVERYTGEVTRCLGSRLDYRRPARPLAPIAGHLWEQVILPTRIRPPAVLWSPANTGPLAVRDQVLTLHDAGPLEHPEWYRPVFATWYRSLLPRLVKRVRRVITVSEHSRWQIMKVFYLPPEKVVAIYAGVNREQFRPASQASIEEVRRRYSLPPRYLLFTGSLEPRKNLGRLAAAWKRICSRFPGVGLVIAGSRRPSFARLETPPDFEALRFLGYVSEADLPILYSGAEAFLLPSLSEGFGLGMLEAMACGTPVIAAQAGALPEIAGSAARLVNPLDVQAWSQAIAGMLDDPNCRAEYRRAGLERARLFPWQRTAEKVWQVLEAARQEAAHR